ERDRDRDQHSGGGDQVASASGARVSPLLDPEDEQGEPDDVARCDEVARLRQGQRRSWDHCPASDGFTVSSAASCLGLRSRPLNMPSIRSVTMNPPTMLIVPKAIAIVPITFSSLSSGGAEGDKPP